jgi:predicted deacylase
MSKLELIVNRLLQHASWRGEFVDVARLHTHLARDSSELATWQTAHLLPELTRVSELVLRLESELLLRYNALRSELLADDFLLGDSLARDVLAFMCAFHAARECVPLARFVVRQFVAILKLNLGDDAHPAIADLSAAALAHLAQLPCCKSQFMTNFESLVSNLLTPPSAAEDMSFVTLAKELTDYTARLWPVAANNAAADDDRATLPERSPDGLVRVSKLDRLDCPVGESRLFALTLFNALDANPLPPLAAMVARGTEHGPVLCVFTIVDESCVGPSPATAIHNITGRIECDRLRGTVIAVVATMPTRLPAAAAAVMRQRLRERLVPACDVVLEFVAPQTDFRCGTTAVCDLDDELGARMALLCDPRVVADQRSAEALLPNAASLALATFEYNRLGSAERIAKPRNTLARPTAVACLFANNVVPQPAAVAALANALALLQMARAHIRRDLEHFPYVLPIAHAVVVADGGMFVAGLPLGNFVKADATVLGTMIDGFGREASQLLAPVDGVLVGVTNRALVLSGTLVAVICRWQQ